MNFNQAEEEYIDGEDTIGLGTLGKEGSGRYIPFYIALHSFCCTALPLLDGTPFLVMNACISIPVLLPDLCS